MNDVLTTLYLSLTTIYYLKTCLLVPAALRFANSASGHHVKREFFGLLLFDQGVYSATGGVVVFNGTNYGHFGDKRL